ncbi:DUF4870 domain-containing protein [Haematomicrobium sanguinis]|uniref:DUF4870 domain-containing protein n=1 Tax=Haematomicrobium sanguinis TaxID=479106 RepID=UPI00047A3E36|nr:DUF4870 domain-containing protein [Haematomicrobium sanguinis]
MSDTRGQDVSATGQASSAEFKGQQEHPAPLTASEDRQWATMSHFGGILGCLPSAIIYMVFKDRGPFTEQEAKEALNFTLIPTIVVIAFTLLSLGVPALAGVLAVVNALIWIAMAVISIKAGSVVNRGRPYRYRLNPRLIR